VQSAGEFVPGHGRGERKTGEHQESEEEIGIVSSSRRVKGTRKDPATGILLQHGRTKPYTKAKRQSPGEGACRGAARGERKFRDLKAGEGGIQEVTKGRIELNNTTYGLKER